MTRSQNIAAAPGVRMKLCEDAIQSAAVRTNVHENYDVMQTTTPRDIRARTSACAAYTVQ